MARVIIEPGEQAHFLRTVKEELGLTWEEMAEICGVHTVSLYRWTGEKLCMSYEALLRLCELSNKPHPPIIEVISEEERMRRAGRKGAIARNKLYGPPTGTPEGYRKAGLVQRRKILTPSQSPLLAEFVCLLLGDGCIRDREVTVNLHRVNEVEYAAWVAQRFKELFGLKATISVERNSRVVRVCSTSLVEYLESIGLHKGNKVKQQVDVPAWIRLGGKDLLTAGVRGLMDTDGGPVLQTAQRVYKTYRYRYSYVRLNFSNSSIPLLDEMQEMLIKLGYRPRKHKGFVHLNWQEELRRYYREIGTSNAYQMKEYIRKAKIAWGEDVSDEVKFLG